ncbi:MAG: hypothetical protein QOH69_678 [Actinomycetota bacterium]|nr:hypothetical protein [Actinomycetota bacterium]
MAQPPAWTPPPKPGLIPLAPMTLGVMLGASFRVLRRNPRPVVGFSLVIHAVLAIITILVSAVFAANALSKYFTDVSAGAFTTEDLSNLLVAYVGSFVSAAFTYGGEAILQGIITQEVARGTLGEKLPLSALWGRSRGRILVLVGWAAAEIGAIFLVAVVLIGAFALLASTGGSAGVAIGVLILVLGILAALVLGIWIGTRLSLVPSALILERLPLGKAIRRSWGLVRGYFWRTFGIQLLVSVMIGIAASIAITPFTLIIGVIVGISHPTGADTAGAAFASTYTLTQIVTTIVSSLIATITAIISTSVTALIYIDLRIRKEGLDLALMRFVDARQAGNADVPDPYLPTSNPT